MNINKLKNMTGVRMRNGVYCVFYDGEFICNLGRRYSTRYYTEDGIVKPNAPFNNDNDIVIIYDVPYDRLLQGAVDILTGMDNKEIVWSEEDSIWVKSNFSKRVRVKDSALGQTYEGVLLDLDTDSTRSDRYIVYVKGVEQTHWEYCKLIEE